MTDENLPLELEKVIDILLITYVDSNLKEVKKLGDWERKGNDLTSQEDDKIHFYLILKHFIQVNYLDNSITKKVLKNIISKMEIK